MVLPGAPIGQATDHLYKLTPRGEREIRQFLLACEVYTDSNMDVHLPAKGQSRRAWPILFLLSFLAIVFTRGTSFSWAPSDDANHPLGIVPRSLPHQVRFDNYSLFVGDQRVFIQYVYVYYIPRIGIPLTGFGHTVRESSTLSVCPFPVYGPISSKKQRPQALTLSACTPTWD